VGSGASDIKGEQATGERREREGGKVALAEEEEEEERSDGGDKKAVDE